MGHEAGDELLVAVAERLRDALRPEDTVGRLGGDEFVILLEDVGIEEAGRIAERAARVLKESFSLRGAGREVSVTASTGIAVADCAISGGGAEALLRKSDMAMYGAKTEGKNTVRIFDPRMAEQAQERLDLYSELGRALEREELTLHYQPIARLGDGKIVGMEALLRWEHPERGLLLPREFIPAAEQTGMIVHLGKWVLRRACRQAARWRDEHPNASPLRVNVNLSARQFAHRGLVKEVTGALHESGLEPSLLELEMTESTVMADVPATVEILNRLKDLGVGIALDDFGTGYSSLSYLKNFPADELKIDRSIVEGLEGDPRNEAIVSAAITLAHALDQRAVAEGVESAAQLRTLRKLGCELGQGEHFWSPLPPEEAYDFYLATSREVPVWARDA